MIQKALTGEALPQEVTEGKEVLSGSINLNGTLKIKVTKEYGESTVSKILELVENASSKKSKSENFITKFARYYTPISSNYCCNFSYNSTTHSAKCYFFQIGYIEHYHS